MPSVLFFKDQKKPIILDDSVSYYRTCPVINIHIPASKAYMDDCIARIRRLIKQSNSLISLDQSSAASFYETYEEYQKTKKPPANLTLKQIETIFNLCEEISVSNTYKRDGGWLSKNCTIM